jgi:predicted ATP-grasp superfamily ATP-dependent carboligase
VIFLCGIPSEQSLGLVIERLREANKPHVVFNQRQFAEMEIELEVRDGSVRGRLLLDGVERRLEAFTAVYTRLMDHRLLPEIENEPSDSPLRQQCQNLHSALMQWHELAPGRVLNRSNEIGLNYSKPMQAELIRQYGFLVPETLVTNDPDEIRAFSRVHERVIYKSSSYVRSVVRLMNDDDMERLDSVRACPVQFQEYIEGSNVRVHTIGGEAFPTLIKSTAVDYRYAYRAGEREKLEPTTLSSDLVERCLRLASEFGLEFAGIDLKITDEDKVYCLEVNPSPAFSYYELHTGQPVSRAVAEYLSADC